MSVTQTLNLTESKQIEKSVANLKLTSIHCDGFAHILSNIECCGYSISSEILSLLHNVIRFLSKQSQKCNNHQLGFTTPFLHLMGTLLRTQDLEFVARSKIVMYLSKFFSLKSLSDSNGTNISFQQRFAAWTGFRTLMYSTSFPMYSPLPTINVNNINKTSNESPSSKCAILFSDETQSSRLKVLNSFIDIITKEIKLLFKTQKKHKINDFKQDDLKQILLKLHKRTPSQYNDNDNDYTNNNNNDYDNNNNNSQDKKTKWSCDVCTYMNGVDDDTCTMCFRGVRPMYNNNDSESDNIDVYILCLNCGASNNPKNKRCQQCKQYNENTSPLTCIYNEKLQILKWCDRLRKQSICNVDTQWLYLLQQEIGWMSSLLLSSSSSSSLSSLSVSDSIDDNDNNEIIESYHSSSVSD
eukprot:346034_1